MPEKKSVEMQVVNTLPSYKKKYLWIEKICLLDSWQILFIALKITEIQTVASFRGLSKSVFIIISNIYLPFLFLFFFFFPPTSFHSTSDEVGGARLWKEKERHCVLITVDHLQSGKWVDHDTFYSLTISD